MLEKINITALKSAASEARNGIACRIPALADNLDPAVRVELVCSQCGGQNCHVDIEFADGVTWIARIRLDDPLLLPAIVQAHIFLSEVATVEFLAGTGVPSLKAYAYGLGSSENNTVGTSYILMEKLPGKPLDRNHANIEQRSRVMEQLTDVYLELEKHPIRLTGSLLPSSGASGSDGVQVGGFAQVPPPLLRYP